ncbi:MAG: heme exporter protein CcmB [Nitrospirota bacterium]|jgi:heme exporter protein B
MTFLRQLLTVFLKDLRLEWRTREAMSAMLLFAILVLVIFNFTFNPDRDLVLLIGPGILWVAFTFAAVLGLNRAFAAEQENGCLAGVLLTPIDRGGIYLGKWLANLVFTLVAEVILLPFFVLFFNLTLTAEIPALLLVCFLGTVGFTAVGTLLAAVSANTRLREVMLPILLFPITVPVIIGAVESTGMILNHETEGLRGMVRMLALYDVIFLVSSTLLFDFVLEE